MIEKIITFSIKYMSRLPLKPRTVAAKLYRKLRLVNRNRLVLVTRDGIRWQLNLGELIDGSIYYQGGFEPDTIGVMNKYVKRGMTCFDIGANVGCHTLRMAKLVGRDGKVIAFEPTNWAFGKLKRNLELNAFSNVVAEKIALSDKNEGIKLACFYASWPLTDSWPLDTHSRDELHPVHGGRRMEGAAEFVTLDSYARRKNIHKIGFIKLDVDGQEYKVISGAVNCLRKFKPIMIVEFGRFTLMECGDTLESLVDLLDSLGYCFYSVVGLKQYGKKEALLKSVPPDGTINVLCKPKSGLRGDP